MIDYIEFIIVIMYWYRLEKEEYLLEVFKYFDKDRSGFVFFVFFYIVIEIY